ncbi:MAG: primosomal protein N' [Chloroflexota bacterium]
MTYAEVAVNSPGAYHGFSYSIPDGIHVAPGQPVLVPFGPRVVRGIVLALSDTCDFEGVRDIQGTLSPKEVLSPSQLDLGCWLSSYYHCGIFEALSPMLPPGLASGPTTFIEPRHAEPPDDAAVTEEERHLLVLLRQSGRLSLRHVQAALGKAKAATLIARLSRRNLILKTQDMAARTVRPKMVRRFTLSIAPGEVSARVADLNERHGHKQAALLQLVAMHDSVSLDDIKGVDKNPSASLRALVAKNLILEHRQRTRRDPLARLSVTPAGVPMLTHAQEEALQAIRQALLGKPEVFLLHGVTGSGKTEIYLRALQETVARGRRGICLVPEISLTPQAIQRFAARFPGRVGVIHSQLSPGEQLDEWEWIKSGACDVVIGPRSALFAPQPDVGLIVIDEEHEWTYKQQDISPRYRVHEVAIQLARLTGATLVLGSATPDIETFHQAQQGELRYLELRERITPRGTTSLPEVEVADLREEFRAGNRSLLSRVLKQALEATLAAGQQSILFLNRRGTATLVECRNCGFVARCRRCSIPLTYHSPKRSLICHHCRYSVPVYRVCPQCLKPRLKFLGVGTEAVEAEVAELFPRAAIIRWDRDTVTRRQSHEEIMATFAARKADILIGTQMIAKGLHFPGVTLAGVISADTGLNLPDFRSGERTFQLLCQVAGRSGRGSAPGRVIIQTFTPEHYAIAAAAKQDYHLFYRQEIQFRRELNYPPFSKLVRLVYRHADARRCEQEAQRVAALVRERGQNTVIGPAPAFVSRLKGHYQWQLVLRGNDPASVLDRLALARGWTVDVDPVGLV